MLFDTGQDRASVTDPDYFPGGLNGLVYSRLAKFEIGPDQTLTAGLAPARLLHRRRPQAVLSHLHQDHIGGLPELGGARIVVSGAEWESLLKPLPEARGLLPNHIELPGLRWDRVQMERWTPGWRRSPAATTCSPTAAWSCCRPPVTLPARSRCWFAGPATGRC